MSVEREYRKKFILLCRRNLFFCQLFFFGKRAIGARTPKRENLGDNTLVNYHRLTGGSRVSFAYSAAIGIRNCRDFKI